MNQPTEFDAVLVSGADAASFLNGQFTSNVLNLRTSDARSTPLLGAFCTPKGRALAVAVLVAVDDGIELWTTASRRQALVAHLSRYVMRAKVAFDPIEAPESRSIDLPGGTFSLTGDNLAGRAVQAGFPLLDEGAHEAFVPQMINLDLLNGIDFTKGCYTGQEIVARTHHLGTIKRRMLAFACEPGAALKPGDDVRTTAGQAVGRIVAAGGERALASVRLASVGDDLSAGDVALSGPLELPYAIPELVPT